MIGFRITHYNGMKIRCGTCEATSEGREDLIHGDECQRDYEFSYYCALREANTKAVDDAWERNR